nr:DUF916 domain-containing protein [Fredinandcohnia onubensis]
MWKKIFILMLSLSSVFCITFNEVTVLSQESGTPLIVEPLYPDNQVKSVKGYFRLKVQPNQKQTVKVKLINNLNEEQKIMIKPANGFTNPVGGMLYSESLESDNSILLEDGIKLAPNLKVESEIILKPKETRVIAIDIIVPNIDRGTILGAVRFITEGKTNEEMVEANEGEANFVLKTETVYAIAVQLDLPIATNPNFSLGNAGFSPEGPSVIIEMTNDAQMIQENISGEYQIEDSEGNQLFEGKINPFKMAPKTQIRHPLPWNYETLEPGDYTLYAKINVNNNEVVTEEEISIGNKQVDEYVERNQPIVPQGEAKEGIPIWVWIISGSIVLAGLMFMLGRRKKTS